MMEMTSVSERPVTESGGTTGVLDCSLFGLRLREGANLRGGRRIVVSTDRRATS